MKKVITILICLFIHYFSFSQWESIYFSTRMSMHNNLYSSPPNKLNERSLNTPDGAIQLFPDIKKNDTITYFYFAPTFNADIFLNFDFIDNNTGIAVGAQYSETTLRYKYYTVGKSYLLEEENNIKSISIPLFLKFGVFEENQYFFFIGGKYNINYEIKQTQTVNFNEEIKFRNLKKEEFKDNITIFIGVNIKMFNIEFDYTPNTYLNTDFFDINEINPYSNQRGGIFTLRTSFNFPFSRDFLKEIF